MGAISPISSFISKTTEDRTKERIEETKIERLTGVQLDRQKDRDRWTLDRQRDRRRDTGWWMEMDRRNGRDLKKERKKEHTSHEMLGGSNWKHTRILKKYRRKNNLRRD